MPKKLILLIAAAVSLLSLPAQAGRQDGITMLVIPRETLPLQIGQDLSRRYPVLLVSYQTVRGTALIHAWNGDSWVSVPVADYTNGTFFANRPKTAIIVENGAKRAPDMLTPSSLWCESAYRLTSTDPQVMLHLLGLHFDFPFRYWDQLAKRYGYALEEINPTLENVYWWNLQSDVLAEKRARRDFSADLHLWQPLATIPPPAVESVVETEEPAPEKPAKPASGDVEITVKASEEPHAVPMPEEAPAPSAAPKPAVTPEPAAAPEKPAAPEPAPMVEAPEAPAVELLTEENVTAAKETATAVAATVEPTVEETIEPLADTVVAPPEDTAEPPAITEDPFAADEIPAAEIIVPPEPKKPWWRLF